MGQDYKHRLSNAVGPIPAASPRPLTGDIPPRKRWRFSFRFWRQVDYFGLDECQKSWFMALLERFKMLSDEEIEPASRGHRTLREHPINWGAESVPIARKHIDWLAPYDSEDTELIQVAISTGLGRIIGFFDEDSVFNIVLVDPLHNLQPSKKFNYRVRPTHVAKCQLTRTVLHFESILRSCEFLSLDEKAELLGVLHSSMAEITGGAVLAQISDEHRLKLNELDAAGLLTGLGDLLEALIDDVHGSLSQTPKA